MKRTKNEESLSPIEDSKNNLCMICNKLFFKKCAEDVCQSCQVMRSCHPGYQEMFREKHQKSLRSSANKTMSVIPQDSKPGQKCNKVSQNFIGVALEGASNKQTQTSPDKRQHNFMQNCSICHGFFQSLEKRLICSNCEVKIAENVTSARQQPFSMATNMNVISPSNMDIACMSVNYIIGYQQEMKILNSEHIDENQNSTKVNRTRRPQRNSLSIDHPFSERYGGNICFEHADETREKLTKSSKYSCEYCSQNFQNSTFLRIHIRSHTGEKPYVCPQCGSGFSQSSSLKTHIKLKHSDEKPFKCGICDKSFAIQNYLKLHVRTHTKEKPYQCSICNDKYFTQKSSLLTHMKKHA